MMQFPSTLPLGIQGTTIDPLRVFILLIEVAFIVLGMHLAFKFLKNYRTLNDTARGSRMYAAWGWLFFSYTLMRAFLLIADFYTLDVFTRDIIIIFGYVSASSGALYFIHTIERVGVIKSHHVFTIIFLILYIIHVVLIVPFIISRSTYFTIIGYFATAFWGPVSFLFLIYMIKVYNLVRGKLKSYSILMIVGLLVMIVGYFGETDLAIRMVGFNLAIRLIGDLGSIAGIAMISLFFSILPSWRELEWRPALESLFVVRKGGISIYEHNFASNVKKMDDDDSSMLRVGSGLEMIRALLQEATTGKLKVIDFKDKKLLIEQGENVMVVMIASMETDSLDFLLHLFLTRFESFYHEVLSNWRGDCTEFEPTKALVQEIFG